jgi:hypothetical protein
MKNFNISHKVLYKDGNTKKIVLTTYVGFTFDAVLEDFSDEGWRFNDTCLFIMRGKKILWSKDGNHE